MNEIEKLNKQMKYTLIVMILFVIVVMLFTALLIQNISIKTKENEDSIYKIELAHMMEINHINASTITQLSKSDISIVCRFSYVDFRFIDRCINDLNKLKNP